VLEFLSSDPNTTIKILMYDGRYIDGLVAVADNVQVYYDNQTSGFYSNNTTIEYQFSENLIFEDKTKSCMTDLKFDFGQPNMPENIENVTFSLKAQSCNLDFQARLAEENGNINQKAIDYSIVITLVAIIFLYSTIQIIK